MNQFAIAIAVLGASVSAIVWLSVVIVPHIANKRRLIADSSYIGFVKEKSTKKEQIKNIWGKMAVLYYIWHRRRSALRNQVATSLPETHAKLPHINHKRSFP
jgi:hypothetical protein